MIQSNRIKWKSEESPQFRNFCIESESKHNVMSNFEASSFR